MPTTELGLQSIDAIIAQARESIVKNYTELVRIGNPPGTNTAQIAFIAYMAKSISGLSKEQLQTLRDRGLLTI
jgi:hypothetical protein